VPQVVLDTLRELQEADRELRRLTQEKAAHDRTVRVRAGQLEAQQAAIETLRAKRLEARKKADQKELEVREKQAEIQRLRTQQTQIKDNRQFAVLQNEIKFAELSITKLEDDILADYEDIEAVEAEIAQDKAKLQKQQGELDALRNEVEAKKDEVDREIEACRSRCDDIARALPREVVDKFNRIADHLDGEVLAAVVRDLDDGTFACGGCHMSVTQNTYVLLRGRTEKLVTCPNCTRILYVPDD